MDSYYCRRLSGLRLKRCYDLAPPRVVQYLDREIEHVLHRVRPGAAVLELGCGYGRVALRLAERAGLVVGIDISEESLELARTMRGVGCGCEFVRMDATSMTFPDETFDLVVCIQNGICAFGADQEILIREALRVTRGGGRAVFATYSGDFWGERLRWFEIQSRVGLIGEIDRSATGGGVIACKDGFRAGALTEDEIRVLCRRVRVEPEISVVDGSSLFFELSKACGI